MHFITLHRGGWGYVQVPVTGHTTETTSEPLGNIALASSVYIYLSNLLVGQKLCLKVQFCNLTSPSYVVAQLGEINNLTIFSGLRGGKGGVGESQLELRIRTQALTLCMHAHVTTTHVNPPIEGFPVHSSMTKTHTLIP